MDESHGRIVVLRVTPGGPAQKSDLSPGDIILTVNKNAIEGIADFYRKVWSLGSAGVEVPLGVLQGARINNIVVLSADRDQYLKPNLKK